MTWWQQVPWSAVALAGAVLIAALELRLQRSFASRRDVDGVGAKLSALETLYIQARETADAARAEVETLRAAQLAQAERITDHVIPPLRAMTQAMEQIQREQAVQTATLEAVCEWVRAQGAGTVVPVPRSRRRDPS